MSSQPSAQTDQSFYARAQAAQAAGRSEEAVQLLWQASRLGDVACMSLLGAMLLSGRGARPDPQTGGRLIIDAAGRGGAYACALASNLAAAGFFGGIADWTRALDYLQTSAELGYAPAQAQLQVLARQTGQAPAPPARLRSQIDLNAWRASPPARALSADPAIVVTESFIAPDVCDWLISRAREHLAPAMVFEVGTLRTVHSQIRTNSSAAFDLVHIDLVVLLICERISAACARPVTAMEAPQVLHYAVGQEFRPHDDFLYPELPDQAADIAAHGQRALTLLVYLNDDFEGGETDFPLLGLRFRGRKGDALMFSNVLADGAPDRRMRHAGLAPTAGEKWLLSQWIRERRAPGPPP